MTEYKLVPIDTNDLPCGITMPLPDGRIIGVNQRIESIVSIEDAYKCAEILHKAMLSAAPPIQPIDTEKLKLIQSYSLNEEPHKHGFVKGYNSAIDHLAAHYNITKKGE